MGVHRVDDQMKSTGDELYISQHLEVESETRDMKKHSKLPAFHDLHGVSYLELIFVAPSNDDIIHLQDHAAKLGRQEQLLSLANKWIDNKMLSHI